MVCIFLTGYLSSKGCNPWYLCFCSICACVPLFTDEQIHTSAGTVDSCPFVCFVLCPLMSSISLIQIVHVSWYNQFQVCPTHVGHGPNMSKSLSRDFLLRPPFHHGKAPPVVNGAADEPQRFRGPIEAHWNPVASDAKKNGGWIWCHGKDLVNMSHQKD